MRLAYAVPLALFLFILGLGGYMLTQPKNQTIPSAMIAKPLPDFELPSATASVEGASRADFLGGEPKLLNIWASWCLPCIAEAPWRRSRKRVSRLSVSRSVTSLRMSRGSFKTMAILTPASGPMTFLRSSSNWDRRAYQKPT